MIDVSTYPVAHGKEKGGGGGVTYITGNVANSDLPDNINVASINASNGNIDYLTGKSLTYNDGAINYLSSSDANIANIAGNNLDYANGSISHLNADEITTGKITAKEAEIEKAWIEILNSKNITTEYLTVTKQAHFFELIIDKIKSVGGTIIETAANCIVDKVKAYSVKTTPVNHGISEYEVPLTANNILSYGIFFRSKNDNGRQISNDWLANDQAICQSFNATEGVSHNVANKYYWRLVTEKLEERYMNLKTGEELQIDTANPPASSEAVVQFNNDAYLFRVTYTTYDSNGDPVESTVKDGWTISPQTVDNIPQAQWDNTNKKMTTTSTAFGIKLVADNSEQVYDDQTQTISNITVGNVIPTKFEFKCTTAARLNVGVIYTDSTSQWFPAPAEARDSYVDDGTNNYAIHLNANNTISMIVITNAEEGDWQTVHGILLSNDLNASPKEVDDTVDNQQQYSAPSEGDNLAQLGYRGQDDPKRSSAIIIAAYQTPDSGVHPPSYAQYRGITDFNLSSHRQTYFDAYDAQFVGNFMVTSGGTQIPIKDYIDSSAVTYTMYTAYADASTQGPNPSTPVLNVNWSKGAPLDPNWTYMGIATSTDDNDTNLQFDNYSWFLIQGSTGPQGATGPAGPAGKYTTFAYRNATSNPLPQGATSTSSLPSGFGRTASTPTAGQYTWMTQSETQLVGATETFGFWNPAIRITGDKGNPGEDGTEIEFIYTRNNGGISGSPNPPAAPSSTFDPGPTGATYNGVYWTNHPVGVAGATMYEYVCQRIKGPTGAWGAYQPSPAAVWSKWGEKGMDGDGYEYIYKTTGATSVPNPTPINWETDQTYQTNDYVPSTWFDEPVTLSVTSGPEYVCTRKKENGLWGAFSDPKVWAHWSSPGSKGDPGPEGPTGPAGQDGENAIQYVLVDYGSVTEIEPTLGATVTQTLNIDLKYKVVKIEGATAEYATNAELDAAGINAYVLLTNKDASGTLVNVYYIMSRDANGLFTYKLGANYPQDFLRSDADLVDANKSIVVSLLNLSQRDAKQQDYRGPIYYTQTLHTVMQPTAQFQIMQATKDDVARISSLVTGSTVVPSSIPTIGGQTTIVQQLSYINVTAEGISSRVEAVNNRFNNYSTTTQTSNMIKQEVSSLNVGTKNYFNFNYSVFGTNTFPFIQGYGIEGYGGQNSSIAGSIKYLQVRNLDFQTNPVASTTEKVQISVCCEMRMQQTSCNVLVGVCNTDPNNIERGQNNRPEVTVNTSWKAYSFTYDITNDTAHFNASDANGHITFEGTTFSNTNRLYVRNLMISKGNVPNDVNVSWKDYESQMTREQALVVADDEWTYSSYLREITDEPTFKGFKVYGRTIGNDLPVQTDLIYKNNLALKQGKIYTLSFYAKDVASTSEPYDNYTYDAYMYGNGGCVNSSMGVVIDAKRIDTKYNVGQPSVGNNSDGITKYMLNRGWQQFIIHWFNANSGNRSVIAMRSLVAQPYRMYIAGVELREGWWDVDGVNSTSLIKQTADEIELKVKNTGINIDDGTIELDANKTTIKGQLILKQPTVGAQGMLFKNSNNQTGLRISTDTIPSLSNFVSGYQGYPHLDLGTNGYGFQSSNRYLYVTNNDIVFYSDANYGKNNEGLSQIRIPQSGGQTGEIIDYIGDMNQSEAKTWYTDVNSTTNVSFVESNVKVQHNGVRCVRLPSNATNAYYVFRPSSKDKILLCYPTNGHRIRIDVGASGVIGYGSNIGHTYYIKIMPRASSNVKVELYGATFIPGDRDLENTLSNTFTITDNCIYTVIVLGKSEGENNPEYVLVGKMQSGDYR